MNYLFIVASILLLASLSGSHAAVLVIGATGRTGSLLYKELKHRGVEDVRALVRDVEKARAILDCNACDPTEGIYVGDVTKLDTLMPALSGVHAVAIAAGAGMNNTNEEIKAIEFLGVQNAVRSLAQDANQKAFNGLDNLKVVLCSSMGSTWFPSNNTFGQIIFQKLNAEAFLGSVGMTTAIVKPCGLSMSAGNNATLLALHDDASTPTGSRSIPRADVARVMAELVLRRSDKCNLRFDLCSIEGPATTDLDALIESAKWSWEQPTSPESEAFHAAANKHDRSTGTALL